MKRIENLSWKSYDVFDLEGGEDEVLPLYFLFGTRYDA